MTNQELISLEMLYKILESYHVKLKNRAKTLREMYLKLQQVMEREKKFLECKEKTEDLLNRMLMFFQHTKVYKQLMVINKDIYGVKVRYEQCLEQVMEVTKGDFDEQLFLSTCEKVKIELEKLQKQLHGAMFKVNEVFKNAKKALEEQLLVIERLINIIERTKSVVTTQDKVRRIEHIVSEKKQEYEIIKGCMLYNDNLMKETYSLLMRKISFISSDLRNFMINEKLLEEHELNILEEIYRVTEHHGEIKISEIIEKLQKTLHIDTLSIIKALINLEKKNIIRTLIKVI